MKDMSQKTNSIKTDLLINAAFQAMLCSTKDMVFVKDADSVYVAASQAFVEMVGKKSVDEIVGHTDLEIFADENLANRYVTDDRKLMRSGINLVDYVEPITEEDGRARYGSTSKYILAGEDGEAMGILGVTRDITRDYFARQRYQQELKYLFELPADTYAVSYIDVDNWRIISQRKNVINNSTLPSCYTVESLVEAALESIVEQNSPAAAFYRNFTPNALQDIYASGRNGLSFAYQRKMTDGTVRWVYNEIRFLTNVDSGHLCVMLTAKDIEAKKQKEQELLLAAQMDRMTMVFNRETTVENIKQILVGQSDKKHALFMIDVDNFKDLNDTLGHQAGDEFLIAYATELKNCFNEDDVVGRIGGDEFFALMTDVANVLEVLDKAQNIMEATGKVCEMYGDVHLSVSIGISVFSEHGNTLEELYANADKALYEAKKKGKNQFVLAEIEK